MTEAENARAAGVRQTDRQLVGADTASIVKAAKNEIGSTYRVYTKEWLPTSRVTTPEAAAEWFAAKYEGRVKDEDWKVHTDPESGENVLSLRLWNVKAEWKEERLAVAHATAIKAQDSEAKVEVVPRNSRTEHVLANYGKLKLPDPKK